MATIAPMSDDLAAKVAEAHKIVADAVKGNRPKGVVALYSGGHDSLISTHIASQHPAFRFAASMDTTIGVPETLEHRREVAQSFQWRPREYVGPRDYRSLVLQYGFPGPGAHGKMYSWLKERPLRRMMHDVQHRAGDRVVLVTGVRRSESKRRMGHVEPIKREGGKVWTAPLCNWADAHKDEYMLLHGLPRNPVSDRLCMSGECLCGSFAEDGEIALIEAAYPDVAEHIRTLEFEARRAGVHAVWGTRPPGEKQGPATGPMCHSCGLKAPPTPEEWARIMAEAA